MGYAWNVIVLNLKSNPSCRLVLWNSNLYCLQLLHNFPSPFSAKSNMTSTNFVRFQCTVSIRIAPNVWPLFVILENYLQYPLWLEWFLLGTRWWLLYSVEFPLLSRLSFFTKDFVSSKVRLTISWPMFLFEDM